MSDDFVDLFDLSGLAFIKTGQFFSKGACGSSDAFFQCGDLLFDARATGREKEILDLLDPVFECTKLLVVGG
jgi:hypothetical protein